MNLMMLSRLWMMPGLMMIERRGQGATRFGDCKNCLVPMRAPSVKAGSFEFRTVQEGSGGLCNNCRRAELKASSNSGGGSDARWIVNYVSDRRRRGIPPEGIHYAGEEPKRPGPTKAGKA